MKGMCNMNNEIADNVDKAIEEILKNSRELNEKIAENLEEIRSTEEFIEGLKNDLASADSGLYRALGDIKLHEEHIEACSARLKNMHAQLEEFDSDKMKEKLLAITAKRMEAELGYETTVIATGGIAKFVLPMCKKKIIYDKDLLVKGLATLYRENKRS